MRTVVVLPLAILALAAPAARAQDHPLCKSLRAVAEAAKARREPVRITATVGGGVLACQPMGEAPAARAFCDLAASTVASEGGHMFPWRLRQCVDTMIAGPVVETAEEVVGPRDRKRIVHLAANMGGGVRLDLSQPPADARRYDLVIWAPRQESRP